MKKILPFIIVFAILIPVITSSVNDAKERKAEEKAKADLIAKEAREKAERDEKTRTYLLGKFDPAAHPDFALVPAKYSLSANPIYLQKEALAAFIKMAEAAVLDGINIEIISATRNFEYQKGIWEKKWTGETLVDGKDLSLTMPDGIERFRKILEYSAAPGTSRHHWGTDIDINMTTSYYFQTEEGKKVYKWLTENANKYGYCQVYNLKGSSRPYGYNEEKWHWSYMPLASKLLEEYKTLVSEDDISGFIGDEYVKIIDLIGRYVLSINPLCQ